MCCMSHNTFTIRCRAYIVHEGKLLVVKHAPDATYWALPGGHMEYGEGVKECLEREIEEELGVRPQIGRLLYVQRFKDRNGSESAEFIFEVTNGQDYIGFESLDRTHAHELVEVKWASPVDTIQILPQKIGDDFKTGTVNLTEVVFINEVS